MKLFGLRGGMNEVDKLRIFSSPIRDFLAVVMLLKARIDQNHRIKHNIRKCPNVLFHSLHLAYFVFFIHLQDPKP